MTAVLEFADVTVRRDDSTLLDAISWTVEEDERWVILGPERRRQDDPAPGRLRPDPPDLRGRRHPRRGARHRRRLRAPTADRPDQRRPRRADPAPRAGARRRRLRVVRRARALARGVRRPRPRAGRRAADRARRRGAAGPDVRHPQRGRAQAGPDRPGADDRPRAAAARRAGRRPRPRRPRGPRLDAGGAGRRRRSRRPPCWSPTTSRRSRPASPTPCCCATVAWSPPGRWRTSSTPRRSATPSGCRSRSSHDGRPLGGAADAPADTRLNAPTVAASQRIGSTHGLAP